MKKILFLLFFLAAVSLPAGALSQEPPALEPLISRATRLMVFSPHPDDETLGAGGLIQRVLKSGGRVKVVFMTSGDGFPEGVEMEDHISIPKAKDFRRYGIRRRAEALKATATLGMKERDVIFLGFPDAGLARLRSTYLLSRSPYRSPFTRETCPPKSEEIIPGMDYTGRDVIREVQRLIARFRPTLVATTPAQDYHPDHNATYIFVKYALTHWDKKNPNHKPALIDFLIHFGQWPIAQGSGNGSRLNPPKDFPDKTMQWVSFQLTPDEVEIKRKAILDYRSQMLVMGRFLMSFARSNELFLVDK
ncbi:MAG: PIG-L family deacetylase [Syntrophobacteraceae bacterium]|nr:PIG-L family deacetylase [Syntrophobacteraceae bacterium]